jgi:MFS family permease
MQINAVIAITFMGHLLNHSLTLIYPVIMIQLAQLYPETSLTTFGMIGSAHYLLYGLGSLPAGWLVDRFGARTILTIYLLGSGLSVAGLVLADSLLQLTIGLTILGLFCSLYHPAGLTLISHNSMKISRHLGVHGIAGSLGLALGPLVSGLLAQIFGWHSPFIFFGSIALATGLYLWLWHPVENVIPPLHMSKRVESTSFPHWSMCMPLAFSLA